MTQQSIQTVLSGLRAYFDMDVAFVSQFVEGDRVFRFVDSSVNGGPLRVGDSDPIDDSYCGYVVSGVLPQVIQDASRHPVAQAMEVTVTLPVGGHLSVPIMLRDGTAFGTLCAFSHVPDYSLDDSTAQVLRAFAVVIGLLLEGEQLDRRAAAAIDNRISKVLEAGGPTMFFQPIVELATGRVVGHEALARFPDRRPPDMWFAEAWAAGRGIELEVSAARAALRDFPRLKSDGYLSVNFAATSCGESEVCDLLLSGPVDKLVVEITEHSAINNVRGLSEQLSPFRALGGRLAIDDVGMGFSGLSQLVELSPDVIKLDRSLVADVANDAARTAMVAALVDYSARVGAALLAEGVEDETTSIALQELGVTFAQGYHFGRPAPPPD